MYLRFCLESFAAFELSQMVGGIFGGREKLMQLQPYW
jgi:hypothetical protein